MKLGGLGPMKLGGLGPMKLGGLARVMNDSEGWRGALRRGGAVAMVRAALGALGGSRPPAEQRR
jgi:hypothetical protein